MKAPDNNSPAAPQAFTRIELAALLAGLTLLGMVVLPVLANTAPRSDRITCFNNLRQIGGAYNLWTTDREGRAPWFVPNPSGNRNLPSFRNLFFQYSWLSNELGTPKILSDPADRRSFARVATSWGNQPQGGLLHPSYQNNAISYWLGLHAYLFQPQSLIAGDPNIRGTSSGSCSSGISPCTQITTGGGAWFDAVHGPYGNLAFMDGRVEQAGNRELRKAIDWNDNWNNHFLFPFF
jgi:hypothetical protein